MKQIKAIASQRNAGNGSVGDATLQLGTRANILWNVLPRRLQRTLRYVESFTMTTGALGVLGTEQVMRINSLYDPNLTGTGHQPYGFDQLSTLYNQHFVRRARVTLLINSPGTTAEMCVAYKIDSSLATSAIAGSSVDAATESPMIGTVMVGPSGVDRARQIICDLPIHDVIGVSRQQFLNEVSNYSGSVSGNPSIVAYFRFAVGSYVGTGSVSCEVQCIIDYDTEFYAPVQAPQS